MNWFQRYGIVGMYFLVIAFLWLYCLGLSPIDLSKWNEVKGFIAILSFAFLPIGYILSVFSQLLYYKGNLGRQIHKERLKAMKPADKQKLGLDCCCDEDEHICEIAMTAFDRFKNYGKDLEAARYLDMFITKRFDVLAINNSLILSTIISLLMSAIIILIKYSGLLLEIKFSGYYVVLLILSSFCIIIILFR